MLRRTFLGAAAALALATPAFAADPVKIGYTIARTGLFAAAAPSVDRVSRG